MADEPDYTRQDPPLALDGAVSSHDLAAADLAAWTSPWLTRYAEAALAERKAYGLNKYGVVLHRDNGRAHSMDAEDEVLDLVVYLRTWIDSAEAGPRPVLIALYQDALWALATITMMRQTGTAPPYHLKIMNRQLVPIEELRK